MQAGGQVIIDCGSTTAVTGNVASTMTDGANVTLGAKADAKSTATDSTAITIMQVLKEINASDNTAFSVNATLVVGAALAGKVGVDQTTPGTTNGVQDASTGSTGSAVSAKAAYMGANSSGNLTEAGTSAHNYNPTTAVSGPWMSAIVAFKAASGGAVVHSLPALGAGR